MVNRRIVGLSLALVVMLLLFRTVWQIQLDRRLASKLATDLVLPTERQTYEEIKGLIRSGAGVNVRGTDGNTALRWAAASNDSEFAQYLLDRGADVNAVADGDETALWTASYCAKAEVVPVLIAGGADLNRERRGINPLRAAYMGINWAQDGVSFFRDADPLIELRDYKRIVKALEQAGVK